MSFAEPAALALLLLLPLIAGLYVWAQLRRRRYSVRYPALSLLREAVAPGARARRHVPAALYLLAIGALAVAAARPTATFVEPRATGTVILALDVSGSMRATDIAPSRIDAAKAAIREFVKKEPRGVRIGLVAFSAGAVLVTPPTEDRKSLLAAVNILQLTRGTNIGDGLRVALESLTSPDPDDPASPLPRAAPAGPVAAGSNPTATIVLLSDGASTTGPDPVQIARDVAAAGIRAHTVGLGTAQGGSSQGGFQGGFSMSLDEPTLRAVAEETGGQYFSAANSKELHQIYGKLSRDFDIVEERMDVTFAFGALAAVLMLAGLGLGAVWSGRLP